MNKDMEASPRRLADLLIGPREDLDLEIKSWLDLKHSSRDKATLAKAVMAMANHGGGFVLMGFEETAEGFAEAPGRPDTLTGYDQDSVNGVVRRYCDPAFHCEVGFPANASGFKFPIIRVPGGHRVPVRAKRAGPGGNVFKPNDIFVRKPGPRSEAPQSGQEWDDLLSRCLENRRDEVVERVSRILTGLDSRSRDAGERMGQWRQDCFDRWSMVVSSLAPDAGARFPHGHYCFAYELVGGARAVSLSELLDVLRASEGRYTGWPAFWCPSQEEMRPYALDGAVACWMGSGGPFQDSDGGAYADFWRVAPDGRAYIRRGHQEDGSEMAVASPARPGTMFMVTIPVWRAGEALLHAAGLAERLFGHAVTIRFVAEYTGLTGRRLVNVGGRDPLVGPRHVSRAESIRCETEVESSIVGDGLPEIVVDLLTPLYESFSFYQPPRQFVVNELDQMRSRSR